MPPNWEQLRDEALEIIAAAGEVEVDLRVVGGIGVRLHCAAPAETLARIGRVAKDIDFVVPKEGRKALRRLLEDRGYLVDRDLLVAMEGRRYSFSTRPRRSNSTSSSSDLSSTTPSKSGPGLIATLSPSRWRTF